MNKILLYAFLLISGIINALDEVQALKDKPYIWQNEVGKYEDDHVIFYIEPDMPNYYFGKNKHNSSYLAYFPATDAGEAFFKVEKKDDKYVTEEINQNGEKKLCQTHAFIELAELEFKKYNAWFSGNDAYQAMINLNKN